VFSFVWRNSDDLDGIFGGRVANRHLERDWTRQVVDRLLADRTLALRRLPGNKHLRVRVEDGLSLAEERDRR
jgi:hypothetical protein